MPLPIAFPDHISLFQAPLLLPNPWPKPLFDAVFDEAVPIPKGPGRFLACFNRRQPIVPVTCHNERLLLKSYLLPRISGLSGGRGSTTSEVSCSYVRCLQYVQLFCTEESSMYGVATNMQIRQPRRIGSNGAPLRGVVPHTQEMLGRRMLRMLAAVPCTVGR